MKISLRKKAITLRKKGFSYSEILREIPVAKSTLSLWLHSVDLADHQKQRLTEKKLAAMKRGWESRKKTRIDKENQIKRFAQNEIPVVNNDNLWLMGVALYWAEGSKQKEHNVPQGICFSNSDPFMIKLFLKWLKTSLKVENENIAFDIYIHEYRKSAHEEIAKYWAGVTGFSLAYFGKIYYKKHRIESNRHNKGASYYGLLRVKVRKSTDLNRKITGWIEGICLQCGVV